MENAKIRARASFMDFIKQIKDQSKQERMNFYTP